MSKYKCVPVETARKLEETLNEIPEGTAVVAILPGTSVGAYLLVTKDGAGKAAKAPKAPKEPKADKVPKK
jgi:hypothetical protein